MPDEPPQDLFKLLGVSRDASDEDILKAHRREAKKYYPGIGSEPDEEKFKEMQGAYETLRDSDKRTMLKKQLNAEDAARARREKRERAKQARVPTEEAANLFGERIRNPHANAEPGVSPRPPRATSPPPRASSARPQPGPTYRPKPPPTPAPSQPPPMRWYEYFLTDSVSGKLLALFASAGLTTAVILIAHAVGTSIEAGASQDHNLLAALVLLGAGLLGGIGGIFGMLLTAYCFFSLIAVILREIGRALRQTP